MIYVQSERITVRDLRPEDIPVFVTEELAQGWHASPEKYLQRLRDRDAGKCIPLTAEYDGHPAGYVSLYFAPVHGPFVGMGWPEIVDFAVLEKYRRRGAGTALMDAAERLAAERADTVTLGVGLHSGYGSAQRMYGKRGYLPDGSGVWFRDEPCAPYGPCVNDDDLILYLSKNIKQKEETL